MQFFSNLSLTLKNAVSFGFILLMMLAIVVISLLGFLNIESGIDDYSEYAEDYAIVSQLQENLLMMRMNVKDFLITNSDRDRQEFRDYSDKFDGVLRIAKSEINKPERAEKVREIERLINGYKTDFAAVEDTIKQRNDLIANAYGPSAIKIRSELSELIQTAYEDGDPAASFVGDQAIQALLLGRIYYTRYFRSTAQSDLVRGKEELKVKFVDALQKLKAEIQNPGRVAILQDVEREHGIFLRIIDQISAAIQQRNNLVLNKLDVTGPQIARLGNQIIESVDVDRNRLREVLIERVQKEKLYILMFALGALGLGVCFTFLANKFVTDPIKKIAASAKRIAQGDLTVRVEEGSKDETGQLAKALNATVQQLNEDMTQITMVSRDLNAQFKELNQLSQNTQKQMEEQQQAADSVATATMQMSTVTDEIAKSTVHATQAVEQTLEKTNAGQQVMNKNIQSVQTLDENITQTSKHIQKLEQNSDEISGIVQVISSISDQTNLLALNAAIESARAGEHGRGFAVVADEVRTLAAKTQASTEEIQKIIDNLQSGTQSAVREMQASCERASECVCQSQETQAALEEIALSIDSLKGINIQVATATEENSVVAQDVSRSIVQVKDSSDETLLATQKSTQVNEHIGMQASCLEGLVSKFTLSAV